jgi:hypothetical protein
MNLVLELVLLHGKPTPLALTTKALYSRFVEWPAERRNEYARQVVVARHSGWHAALLLSVSGLLDDATDDWIVDNFDDESVRDYLRDDTYCYALVPNIRLRLKEHGLLKLASADWLARRLEGKELFKALVQSGKLSRDLGRDWLASAFPHHHYLRKALSWAGLLTPECGPDWYVDHGLELVAASLGIIGPDLGLSWFEERLKGYGRLFRTLKAIDWFPSEPGIEWYVSNFELYERLEVTKRAGLLTDADWCVSNLLLNELPEALAACGTFDRIKDRAWYIGVVNRGPRSRWPIEKDLVLLELLERAGLLDSSRDATWYKSVFEDEAVRAKAMEKAGVLTTRDSIADAYRGEYLVDRLRLAGLLTDPGKDGPEWPPIGFDHPNFGRDWYAKRLEGEHLLDALRESGLLTPDPGREWYAEHLRDGDLISALKACGMFEPARGREWYAKHLKGQWLVSALGELGLLTREPGHEWYRARLNGSCLVEALRRADAFPEDIEWYAGAFDADTKALLQAMDAGGLLTAAPGRDWYARVLGDGGQVESGMLFDVLTKTGLMTADAGRDWYAAMFRGKQLHDALKIAGLLTADAGHDWYARHMSGRVMYETLRATDMFQHDSAECIKGDHWSHRNDKYADMALYRAGLLPQDNSHRWFASHLEGEDLYRALRDNGLLERPLPKDDEESYRRRIPDFKWYAYRFEGELLFRVLDEAGLIPTMPKAYICGYLKGDLGDRAMEIKREAFKGHPHIVNRRGGPVGPGHEDHDEWTMCYTDSRNSVSYYSSYGRRSRASSDDLLLSEADADSERSPA